MEVDFWVCLVWQILDWEKQLLVEGIVFGWWVEEVQVVVVSVEVVVQQVEVVLWFVGVDVVFVWWVVVVGWFDDVVMVCVCSDGLVVSLDVKLGQCVKEVDLLLCIVNLCELWLEIQVSVGIVLFCYGEIMVLGCDVVVMVQFVGVFVGESQIQILWVCVMCGVDKLCLGEVIFVCVLFVVGSGWSLLIVVVIYQDDRVYVFVCSFKGFVVILVMVVSSVGQVVQVQGQLKIGIEVVVMLVIVLKFVWLGLGGGE